MALEEYKRKRDFQKTPEPAGDPAQARSRAKQAAGAVVRDPEARRPPAALRFPAGARRRVAELGRAEGPSLDPADKRLAMHVEDHPIDMAASRASSRRANTAAAPSCCGTAAPGRRCEPDPAEAYRKGTLKFRLHGEKLHGSWALVRMGGKRREEGGRRTGC